MAARVLIIDREPYFRKLVKEELEERGFVVYEGDEASLVNDMLCCCRPDLVLLDLHAHGGKGWKTLKDLKRSRPDIPVLILTAYDSFSDDPCFYLADGMVIKSIDFANLESEVMRVLRQRRSPAGGDEERRCMLALLTVEESQRFVV